jgi:hypothetical protein
VGPTAGLDVMNNCKNLSFLPGSEPRTIQPSRYTNHLSALLCIKCKLPVALRAQCQPGDRIYLRLILICFSQFREMVRRDSVVGIATDHRTTVRGLNTASSKRFFSSQKPSKATCFLFNTYRGSFSVIKQPEREVNDSSPSSAQVKYECSETVAPPIQWC